MIVDGDSVATLYPHHKCWPQYVADERKEELKVLAQNESTAYACWKRLCGDKSKEAYYLCLGQWSQNHEPLDEFAFFLEKIALYLRAYGREVHLLTGTADLGNLSMYSRELKLVADRSGWAFHDLRAFVDALPPDCMMADGAVRCHFSANVSEAVARYIHACR